MSPDRGDADAFDGATRAQFLAGDLRARLLRTLALPRWSMRLVDADGTRTIDAAARGRGAAGFVAAARAQGLGPGDVVAIAIDDGAAALQAWVGATLAGLVPTFVPPAQPELARTGGATVALWVGASTPSPSLPRWDEAPGLPTTASSPGAPALLQRTGGTTDAPRMIAPTHAQVLAQLWGLGRALALTRDDRLASFLPLHHDMGLVSTVLLPLLCGIDCVRLSPSLWRTRPESFLRTIADAGATLTWVPPAALGRLAVRVDPDGLALASLRQIVCGGEPVVADLFDAFARRFAGCGLRSNVLGAGWGAAENVAAITQSPLATGARRLVLARDALALHRPVRRAADGEPAIVLVSCGPAIEGTTVTVVDDLGRALPERSPGLLRVAGDCVGAGHFDSGDVGLIDGGEVFVLGRRDELLAQGHRVVLPQELEAAAAAVPGVIPGRCEAVADDDGRIVLLLESELPPADQAALVAAVGDAVEARAGVRPDQLRVLPRGWLRKSSAGKHARGRSRARLRTP